MGQLFYPYFTVRGCGHTKFPMLVGILSMFLGRVPAAMLLSRSIGANGVHWSPSICWSLEAIAMVIYYLKGKWRKSLDIKKETA